MKRHKPIAKRKSHPLDGKFVHTFKTADHKQMHYQGQIIGVDGAVCLVQLFEWLMGEPTNIEPMRKDFIYSPLCVLYSDREAWIAASDQFHEQKRMQACT